MYTLYSFVQTPTPLKTHSTNLNLTKATIEIEREMKGTPHLIVLFVALFFSAAAADFHGGGGDCVYAIYAKTGSVINAGTDSKISLALGDSQGRSVQVPDLQSWGLMEPKHDYYERGNLDIFSGRGPCIDAPMCRLNLTSDGQGAHHGWYCDYVEITSTGPHKECRQTIFYVDQWLATDAPPFKLTALLDGCRIGDDVLKKGENGKFVVENVRGSAAA